MPQALLEVFILGDRQTGAINLNTGPVTSQNSSMCP